MKLSGLLRHCKEGRQSSKQINKLIDSVPEEDLRVYPIRLIRNVGSVFIEQAQRALFVGELGANIVENALMLTLSQEYAPLLEGSSFDEKKQIRDALLQSLNAYPKFTEIVTGGVFVLGEDNSLDFLGKIFLSSLVLPESDTQKKAINDLIIPPQEYIEIIKLGLDLYEYGNVLNTRTFCSSAGNGVVTQAGIFENTFLKLVNQNLEKRKQRTFTEIAMPEGTATHGQSIKQREALLDIAYDFLLNGPDFYIENPYSN